MFSTRLSPDAATGSSDFLGFNVYYMMVAEYIDPNVPNESTKIPVMGKFLDDLPFVKISIDGLDPQHLISIMSMVSSNQREVANVIFMYSQYQRRS